MKHLSTVLCTVALILFLNGCQTGGKTDKRDNKQEQTANAAVPPGMEEITEEKLRAAAMQNPEDPTAHYNLGTAYLAQKKYKEAVEEYRQVVAKDPKDSTRSRASATHTRARPARRGRQAYQQALKVNPKHAEAHHRLGEVYDKLGGRRRPRRSAARWRNYSQRAGQGTRQSRQASGGRRGAQEDSEQGRRDLLHSR